MAGSESATGRFDRAAGWLLFLPVPIVLVLFTRYPLGPHLSLGLGLILMLTHPLYARRWSVRRSRARCLWCGARLGGEQGNGSKAADAATGGGLGELRVTDPRGTVDWGACSPGHEALARRALTLAWRMRGGLRGGIIGALVLSLPAIVLGATHRLGSITPGDGSAFLRLVVAVTVLPLGWLGMPLSGRWTAGGRLAAGESEASALRAPFPLHIAALPGIAAVLWLFRLIGLFWLFQGARHFFSLLA